MLGRDGIAGLICFGLSILLLVLSRGLPQSALVPIGPGFYPKIVLGIMAALSVMVIAADVWTRWRSRVGGAPDPAAPNAAASEAAASEAAASEAAASEAAASEAAASEAAASEAAAPEERNYRLVSVTFAVFAVYVLLLPYLGFRVATFLFVAALQVVLGKPQGRRRWIIVITAALATVIVTYLAFEVYLSVLLPRGRWTGF